MVPHYKSLNAIFFRADLLLEKERFIWVSMYLARKCWLGTLFLHLLLETGAPFYVAPEPREGLGDCSAKRVASFLSWPWSSNGPAPGIELATSRSAVKRSNSNNNNNNI